LAASVLKEKSIVRFKRFIQAFGEVSEIIDWLAIRVSPFFTYSTSAGFNIDFQLFSHSPFTKTLFLEIISLACKILLAKPYQHNIRSILPNRC